GRASSVSLDDPDVRMAAEALGDLRADFISSPPNGHTPLPSTSSPRSFAPDNGAEPLFSLLTTSHPLIANTIDTANKAYTTSKKTYPRFKSGAEYIEGYLSPVASTVGSVGRATGVHGGIRWFLGAGRRHGSSSSDLETGSRKSQKRRKVDNKSSGEQGLDALADKAVAARSIANLDLYDFTKDRRNSISTVDTQDTLPAYDDTGRSPDYSDAPEPQNQIANRPNASATGPWQQRLIMSTSGLSIAMSKESLRSLKYCLQWLRWANEHIAKTIAALKSLLQQYDGSGSPDLEAGRGEDQEMINGPESTPTTQDRSQLAARVTELKSDVLKTLRDVIDTVSKYAGGALPDNARVLVHRHLTSLPQRFRVATLQDASAKKQGDGAEEQEVRDSAQRVLVLAKEGLDMMEQVSGVLDGTIHSAEEWCQRLGKTDEGKKDE
ncbi:transcription factor Opi1, partial [Coniochaeta ligniaria NRRL 30616]